jgi:putative ATP-binding cassette transporter
MEEALPDPTDPPAQQSTALERGKRRLLIRRFWSTAIGFWGRHGRPTAWILSAAVLTIIVFNLAMLYAINLWNRKIFDGLQNHDAAAVFFLSLIYFPILAASVASTVTQVYVRMTLQRRWRAWLNDRLVDRWLATERLDYAIPGGRHRLTARVSEARIRRPDFIWSPYQGFDAPLRQNTLAIAGALTSTLSPNVTNETRLS